MLCVNSRLSMSYMERQQILSFYELYTVPQVLCLFFPLELSFYVVLSLEKEEEKWKDKIKKMENWNKRV